MLFVFFDDFVIFMHILSAFSTSSSLDIPAQQFPISFILGNPYCDKLKMLFRRTMTDGFERSSHSSCELSILGIVEDSASITIWP